LKCTVSWTISFRLVPLFPAGLQSPPLLLWSSSLGTSSQPPPQQWQFSAVQVTYIAVSFLSRVLPFYCNSLPFPCLPLDPAILSTCFLFFIPVPHDVISSVIVSRVLVTFCLTSHSPPPLLPPSTSPLLVRLSFSILSPHFNDGGGILLRAVRFFGGCRVEWV